MLVYLAAMLVIGIPLLTMEIAIGRKVRGGAPKAMHSIKKKFEPIGWAATANAFVIEIYYAVVFGWVILMTVCSYKFANLTGDSTAASGVWADLLKTTWDTSGYGTISWPVLICLLVGWIVI